MKMTKSLPTFLSKIGNFLFFQPLRTKSQENHAKLMKKTLLFTCIYAIIYGIYEYFIVYTYGRLMDLEWFDEWLNWSIMVGLLLIGLIIITKLSFEFILMGVFLHVMLEDITYWICQWIDTGVYPYPVVDWWDGFYASFRVLGYIGQPMSVFPYFPLFYIPCILFLVVYFWVGFRHRKFSRACFDLFAPFMIVTAIGMVVNDALSLMFFQLMLPIAYLYILIVILLYKLKITPLGKRKES